jgi:hypothetical protein
MDAATGAFYYVGLSHGLAGNRQGFPSPSQTVHARFIQWLGADRFYIAYKTDQLRYFTIRAHIGITGIIR